MFYESGEATKRLTSPASLSLSLCLDYQGDVSPTMPSDDECEGTLSTESESSSDFDMDKVGQNMPADLYTV